MTLLDSQELVGLRNMDNNPSVLANVQVDQECTHYKTTKQVAQNKKSYRDSLFGSLF